MNSRIKPLKITDLKNISCFNTTCQRILKKDKILIFYIESYEEWNIYDDNYITYELYGYINPYGSQKIKCYAKVEIHEKNLRTTVSINDLIDAIQKNIDKKTDNYLDYFQLYLDEYDTKKKHNKKKKENINKFEIDYADDENITEPAQSNPITNIIISQKR
jgi:hypothetical protein